MNSTVNEKLLSASAGGDVETILTAIKEGADVNAPDIASPYRYTPLILASRAGFTGAATALISAKADINLPDSNGFTPLIAASWFGKIDTVSALLDSGAKIDDMNLDGNSALMEAAIMGHEDVVSMLIKAGASIGKINRTGHSAYDLAKTKGIKELINNKMNLIDHICFAVARLIRKSI